MDRQVELLREDEPNEDYFETAVGHFWGMVETQPYIGDNMGVRDLVPAQMLRVGQEQRAYDFVKWYMTEGQRGDYDWDDMSLPYLNVKDADVFDKLVDLPHIAAVLLLKIKIVLDLSSLDRTALVGTKVPQEVLDVIRAQTPSTAIVRDNQKLLNSADHKELIATLDKQIEEIIKWTGTANKYFLPAIVEPKHYLTARPEAYSHGSPQQMYLALQYSYDAWVETPGAISFLKAKLDK